MDSLDLQVIVQARDWREHGHAVWLVTVIETWGSECERNPSRGLLASESWKPRGSSMSAGNRLRRKNSARPL